MITVEFNRLQLFPGDRVLDIGCGSGRHSCGLYARQAVRIVAADRNGSDLNEARKGLKYHRALGEHAGGSWRVMAADIHDLPFDSGVFHAVICSEVLEHVDNVGRALSESIRVLRSGRILAISVPRRWPEKICWALSNDYHHQPGGHERIFHHRRLMALLEEMGLIFTGRHYAHSLHTPYWWLKCLVGPQRTDCQAVNAYHRFLTWQIMKKPRIVMLLDRLLNPLLGKSLVLYFRKRRSY